MPRGKKSTRLPPPNDSVIRPIIEQYVAAGYTNSKIVKLLRNHYDCKSYNVLSLLKRRRMIWGLKSARGQGHTVENIADAIEDIRERFPNQGSHDMKQTLLSEAGIAVSCAKILQYINLYHRDEVVMRTRNCLKPSIFWTAGVNDLWSMDQHDKWCRFQLFLHVGIEPFSGYVLWLKIWWTNRNPRLICGWFCDVMQHLGGMPLTTQSDPGSENNGIANGQTILRHMHDPTLKKTLQHAFRGSHCNIKPEIFWSGLRKRWTPGFEKLLDKGLINEWYHPEDTLERMVFHFLFIPYLQSELDRFRVRVNDSKPRHNARKILPHGRPGDVFHHPEDYESVDFLVKVHPPFLEEVRNKYAPPNHAVFDLVPPLFAARFTIIMDSMPHEQITFRTVWHVYRKLLVHCHAQDEEAMWQIIRSAPVRLEDNEVHEADHIEVLDMPPHRAANPNDDDLSDNELQVVREQEVILELEADEDLYEFEWTEPESDGEGAEN